MKSTPPVRCPFYGSRKIATQLRLEFGVSHPTVQAYMREMGVFVLVPGHLTHGTRFIRTCYKT